MVLPGDYVGEEVALAYAVTIHKAQGLTVDSAIVLVDERTTTEGLYVGMTRGRAHNVAMAVCDEPETEHAPPGPTRRASEVLVAALGRSAAEVAALEALREALARSESLAILAPRLANLDAWIAKETPPDRSRELQWAADGLEHARAYCRPGHLTRSGREDRRRLEAAQARYDAVAAEQGQRQAWLEAHADTLAYRDELAEAVTKRRRELGVAAAITQPGHVVDLIGAVPSDNPASLQRWTNMAGRIEASRESGGWRPNASPSAPVTCARAGPGRPPCTPPSSSANHRRRCWSEDWTRGSAWSCDAGCALTSPPGASLVSMVPGGRCPGPSRVRWRRATPALDRPSPSVVLIGRGQQKVIRASDCCVPALPHLMWRAPPPRPGAGSRARPFHRDLQPAPRELHRGRLLPAAPYFQIGATTGITGAT